MLLMCHLTRGTWIGGLGLCGVLGCRILPGRLAAPMSWTFAHRFDRPPTMIATDLVRAALIAAVPFTPIPAAVYVIAFVLAGMSLVFLPASDAMEPNMVPRSK